MVILAFDPGESTGWVLSTESGEVVGGTAYKHSEIAGLIRDSHPDIVIYETFQLYPNMASKMAFNTFYPCEVIGVIKLVAEECGSRLVPQQPSVKKFCGRVSLDMVKRRSKEEKLTEHTLDALMHLRYFIVQKLATRGNKK